MQCPSYWHRWPLHGYQVSFFPTVLFRRTWRIAAILVDFRILESDLARPPNVERRYHRTGGIRCLPPSCVAPVQVGGQTPQVWERDSALHSPPRLFRHRSPLHSLTILTPLAEDLPTSKMLIAFSPMIQIMLYSRRWPELLIAIPFTPQRWRLLECMLCDGPFERERNSSASLSPKRWYTIHDPASRIIWWSLAIYEFRIAKILLSLSVMEYRTGADVYSLVGGYCVSMTFMWLLSEGSYDGLNSRSWPRLRIFICLLIISRINASADY